MKAKRPAITVRPVGAADWPALEKLFGARGACAGCWCMYWRAPRGGREWHADKGEPNRRKLARLVAAGHTVGCLAWAAGEAVGWISVAPREGFPYFSRSRALPPLPGTDVWSVTCFFVAPAWRRRGVARRLLRGAVSFARRNGAKRIEGYPANLSRGRQSPAAFIWTGVPSLFERESFVALRHPRSGRTVYQRSFGHSLRSAQEFNSAARERPPNLPRTRRMAST